MLNSQICEQLGIKYPIIQGAMPWISESSLASAVSEAGGLGIIAAGGAPAEHVREEILKAKELTDKPFGVNIMLMSPHADDIAHLVCELGVKVITTGAGNPGKYMEMWKEHGIKVIPVVASVGLAKRMQRAGADAVIAEGCEAGGHIGELTTMALIPRRAISCGIPDPELVSLMPPVRGDFAPTEMRALVGAAVPVTIPGAKTTLLLDPRG